MILIVGLGNPGPKYQNTRHNLGFMVLDKLAKELLSLEETKWRMDNRTNALLLQVTPDVILVKPQTFMNASGFTIQALIANYSITPPINGVPPATAANYSNLWVIHDDVDLPLGKLKIRFGGASAGHHGVGSIIEKLGTDKFLRIRIGVGRSIRGTEVGKNRSAKDVEEYVLGEFREEELGELRTIIKRAIKAIKVALKEGPERAMNLYN